MLTLFLLLFIISDLLGCVGYAYLHYLRPNEALIGVPYFIFLGFGLVFIFILINQRTLIKNWRLIIDKKKQYITLIKGTKSDGFSIGFDKIDEIKLLQERRKSNSTASNSLSRTQQTARHQIYLIMKDKSLLWIDGYSTKTQAKKNGKLLATFIQRPIINTLDDEKIINEVIEYPSVPAPKPKKGRFIRTQTLRGNKKELAVRIKQPLINRVVRFFILTIVSLFPFAIIDSPYDGMDFLLFGFFMLILLVFVFAIIVKNKKYTLIKDEKGLEIKLNNPILFTKKETSIQIEAKNIQDIQLHRLDRGHYWLSLLLKDIDLDFSHKLNFNIGIFSKDAIKKNGNSTDQQLGLWEVPSSQKDTNGLSFENLVYIQNWLKE